MLTKYEHYSSWKIEFLLAECLPGTFHYSQYTIKYCSSKKGSYSYLFKVLVCFGVWH